MNKELYDKIYNKCIFKRKGLLKEIFAQFDDFIFVRYHYDCGGEYLIYFEFKDDYLPAALSFFTKDIIGEIEKYVGNTYYIECVYKFCSCIDNCEDSLRELFRIKTKNNIRRILNNLTVHIDKHECHQYLMKESFCFDINKI